MRSVRHLQHLHPDIRERGKIWECRDESVARGSGSAHQQHGRIQRNRGLDCLLCRARKDQRSTQLLITSTLITPSHLETEEGSEGNVGLGSQGERVPGVMV